MLVEIALVIAYLGIFVGLGLGKSFKKEVKDGKKYLVALQYVILFAALFWFFFSGSETELKYKVVIAAVLIVIHLLLKNDYAVLGLVIGFKPDFLMISLGFLYGFPSGSLLYKENYVEVLKKTIGFLVFAIAGFLLKNYLGLW